jgi:hypothetical protein
VLEDAPPPPPVPKLVGLVVNPLYVSNLKSLLAIINVAVLVPNPPAGPPNSPPDCIRVKPLRSIVPDTDIITFEPDS